MRPTPAGRPRTPSDGDREADPKADRQADPEATARGVQRQDVDEVVTAVLTASRVLVGVAARSLEVAEPTVTPQQFRTLVVLHTRGEINLGGLAERLGVNASSAARMIDKLVAQQLVSRTDKPGNRREVQLRLTPDGTALVRKVTARRRREIATLVAAMPAERHGELVAALSAFARAADEPPADEVTILGW